MSKHTPGPWTGGREAINDSKGRLIANVWFKGVSGDDIPSDEGRANSALIASAPILLWALKQVSALPCAGVDENNDCCGVTFTCSACRKNAIVKNAIEKAEGEPESESA